MKPDWRRLVAAFVALVSGPVVLYLMNTGVPNESFSSPVGGDRWYSTRPAFFRGIGFHDPELSPHGDVFNWSDTEATIRFDRLDRREGATVIVRLLARERDGALPDVVFFVDGADVKTISATGRPQRVPIELPKKRGRGAAVSFRVVDPRNGETIRSDAGVIVENIRLSGPRPFRLTNESFGTSSLASLSVFVVAWVAGVSVSASLAIGVLYSAGVAWLFIRGGAFLGPYTDRAAWIVFVAVLLGLAVARVASNPHWKRAGAAAILVASLKLMALCHPSVVDADAAFHAKNLGRVAAGDLFFTSDTPPPSIAFPYPPGLSLVALPFYALPQRLWVLLLRSIVIAAEVLAAAIFGRVIAIATTAELGALAFFWMTLSPEGTAILFVGNLSNLFGDALLLIGIACLIARREILASMALLGAFLSHFGTLLFGAPLALVTCLNQHPAHRVARRPAPVFAALLASLVLYYWKFASVFRDAIEHLSRPSASAAGPMNAPVALKFEHLVAGSEWWIGAIAALGAIAGFLTWPREREGLKKALAGWIVVAAVFVLIGLVTPVQLRTGLGVRGAIAAFTASALTALWERGTFGRCCCVLLVLGNLMANATAVASFFPLR